MSMLLDTDTCSAYLRGNHAVWQRVLQHAGRLSVSAITAGELYTWSHRAKTAQSVIDGVTDLLTWVHVLDVNDSVAKEFGRLRGMLLDAGKPPPFADLLIAATAMVHNLTLVTHNTADFSAIPGLRLEDWMV